MRRHDILRSAGSIRFAAALLVLVLGGTSASFAAPPAFDLVEPIRPVPGLPVLPIEPLPPLALPSAVPGVEGDWINVDPATGGITRLVINRKRGALLFPQYTVHAYGKCHPTDCDWGEVNAGRAGDALVAVYEPGFKTATVTIDRLPGDRLQVHAENVFHDGTARDYEADYTFRRAWSAEDMIGAWVNVDPATRGMTWVVIDKPSFYYTVHGYGSCVPTDCDWGAEPASYVRGGLEAIHEPGFKTNTMTVSLLADGRLRVHSENVFHDGTARDYVADDTFRRAWDPADLLGEWVNVDADTRGMTRLIVERPDRFIVHGFGACVPTDCDWGEEVASVQKEGLLAVYEPGFKVNTISMRLLADGRLHVHSVNVFTDGTGRDYEADYYLRRAGAEPLVRFVRGDSNANGTLEVTDAIFTLGHLFSGGDEPICLKAADANDTGTINLGDPIRVLQYLFLGGEPCPAPSEGCGVDPTPDALPCEAVLVCS